MASTLGPLELKAISLPPIPGPIPPTFFTDIPSDSAAAFSTNLGTKPLRPLPFPVPVNISASGSDQDIRNKAWSLLETHPTVAESITTPPAAWKDLYHYFDATDLWMEGAGFLFHVLGFIVRVNLTKLDEIHNYARQWVLLNEARLASMTPRQDFLRSVQTPEDQAWFDYDNMSSYEKGILNSVLKWHYEILQATKITSQAMHLNEPEQVVMGTQRRLSEPLADPYQHFSIRARNVSPSSSKNLSQPVPAFWETNSNQQAGANIDPYYRNKSITQPYAESPGPTNDSSHQAALRSVAGIAENHFVSSNVRHQFPYDRRQSTRGIRPLGSFHKHPPGFKNPVYVLGPQKLHAGLHNEVVGPEGSSNNRPFLVHPYHGPQNINYQRRNSQDIRRDAQNFNSTFAISNDARLHCDDRFNRPDGGAPAMPWHSKSTTRKASWPENEFHKLSSVFVAGFLMDPSAGDWLKKLFSECGEITNIKVLTEKFCAFITFKDPETALGAIDRFDGYMMESGKFLTVKHRREKRTVSYGNFDAQQVTPGAPLRRTRTQEFPSPPNRNTERNERRDNYKFARTTPPQNPSYSLLKPPFTLPPNPYDQTKDTANFVLAEAKTYDSRGHHLPPKPQAAFPSVMRDLPSAGLNLQSDCFQSPIGTPEKNQHDSGQGQMTATRRQKSLEGSSHAKHEKSKLKRRSPKKLKNSTSTTGISESGHLADVPNSSSRRSTPRRSSKQVSENSTSYQPANGVNTNLTSAVALPVLSTESPLNKSCPTVPETTTSNDLSQRRDSSYSSSSSECLQMNSTLSISQTNIKSVSSYRGDCNKGSNKPLTKCVETTFRKDIQLLDTKLPALGINTVATPGAPEPLPGLNQPERASELPQQQHRKKSKSKMKSSNNSNRNSDHFATDIPTFLPVNNTAKDTSQTEARSHVKSHSNTTASSTTSGQGTPPKNETVVSGVQRTSAGVTISIQNIACDGTPDTVPMWQSQQTNKPLQSEGYDGDDIFHDRKPTLFKHRRNSKRQSQERIDIKGSATPSTGKTNSVAKKSRAQNGEESPTPTGKPQTRVRNNKNDKKTAVPDQKENRKPAPSPTDILSDPSHWPALGSTKLQVETKSSSNQTVASLAKPTTERTLQPVLPRRDSMASVLSNSPQPVRQPVRRLTIDSPSYPVSGGSQLWPVVKRWDGRGQPPDDKCNSSPPSNNGM